MEDKSVDHLSALMEGYQSVSVPSWSGYTSTAAHCAAVNENTDQRGLHLGCLLLCDT